MPTNRFLAKVRSGVVRTVAGLNGLYEEQLKRLDEASDRRRKAANSRMERDKVRTETEMAFLKLQQEMYEAQAEVIKQKAKTAEARRAAGHLTLSEQVSRGVSQASKQLAPTWKRLSKAQGGLFEAPRKRKVVRRSKRVLAEAPGRVKTPKSRK